MASIQSSACEKEATFSDAPSIVALLRDDTTMCPICLEHFDEDTTGSRAPIAPACCGNAVCRACVMSFHAAKQEASTNRIKLFPCLSCNVPKALHIETLPAPHQGFLRLLSVANEVVLHHAGGPNDAQRHGVVKSSYSSEAFQSKIEEAVASALGAQAESETKARAAAISEALSAREKLEKLARQRAISEAVQVQADREKITRKTAVEEAVTSALGAQAESETKARAAAISEALSAREKMEKLARQRAVSEAVQVQADREKRIRKKAVEEAVTSALGAQAESETKARAAAISEALSAREKMEKLARQRAVSEAVQAEIRTRKKVVSAALEEQRETDLQEREKAVSEAIKTTVEQEAFARGKMVDTAVESALEAHKQAESESRDASLRDVMALLAKNSERAELAESEVAKVKAQAASAVAELKREKAQLLTKSESESASRAALEDLMAALAESSRRAELAKSDSATAEAQAASTFAELEREKARALRLEAAVGVARSECESAVLKTQAAAKRESDQLIAFISELESKISQARAIPSQAATSVITSAEKMIESRFESSPDSILRLTSPSTSTSSNDSRSSGLTCPRDAFKTPSPQTRKRSRWGMAPEPLSTPCLLLAFQVSEDATTPVATEMSDAEFLELRKNDSVLATVEATGGQGKDGEQLASDAMRKSKAPDFRSSKLSSNLTNFQPSPLQTNNQGRSYRTLELPSEHCPRIIGSKGKIIRSIQQRSRTNVSIPKGSGSMCTATITGSPNSIERAIDLITHQITSALPRSTRPVRAADFNQSENNLEDVSEITASSKCADSSGAGGDGVAIPVSEQVVAEAELLTSSSERTSLVSTESNFSGELSSQQVHEPTSRMLPPRPETTKSDSSTSAVGENSTPSAVAEAATLEDVKDKEWPRGGEQGGIISKRTLISTDLSPFEPSALQVDELTGNTYRTLLVPNDLCSAIIGHRGVNHRLIHKRSQARVEITGRQSMQTVTVTGTSSSIKLAFQLISNIFDEFVQKKYDMGVMKDGEEKKRGEDDDVVGGGGGAGGELYQERGSGGGIQCSIREAREGGIPRCNKNKRKEEPGSREGKGRLIAMEKAGFVSRRKLEAPDVDSSKLSSSLMIFEPSPLQTNYQGQQYRTLKLSPEHCPRGETIRSIGQRSRTHLNISKGSGSMRLVTITGAPDSIERAVELISHQITTLFRSDVQEPERFRGGGVEQKKRAEDGGGREQEEKWEVRKEQKRSQDTCGLGEIVTARAKDKLVLTIEKQQEPKKPISNLPLLRHDEQGEIEGGKRSVGGQQQQMQAPLERQEGEDVDVKEWKEEDASGSEESAAIVPDEDIDDHDTGFKLDSNARSLDFSSTETPPSLMKFQPFSLQIDSRQKSTRTLLMPSKHCTGSTVDASAAAAAAAAETPTAQPNTCIIVSNLDHTASSDVLTQVFESFGGLEKLLLVKDETSGSGTVCAVIQFGSEEAAVQALSLNGVARGTKSLTVALGGAEHLCKDGAASAATISRLADPPPSPAPAPPPDPPPPPAATSSPEALPPFSVAPLVEAGGEGINYPGKADHSAHYFTHQVMAYQQKQQQQHQHQHHQHQHAAYYHYYYRQRQQQYGVYIPATAGASVEKDVAVGSIKDPLSATLESSRSPTPSMATTTLTRAPETSSLGDPSSMYSPPFGSFPLDTATPITTTHTAFTPGAGAAAGFLWVKPPPPPPPISVASSVDLCCPLAAAGSLAAGTNATGGAAGEGVEGTAKKAVLDYEVITSMNPKPGGSSSLDTVTPIAPTPTTPTHGVVRTAVSSSDAPLPLPPTGLSPLVEAGGEGLKSETPEETRQDLTLYFAQQQLQQAMTDQQFQQQQQQQQEEEEEQEQQQLQQQLQQQQQQQQQQQHAAYYYQQHQQQQQQQQRYGGYAGYYQPQGYAGFNGYGASDNAPGMWPTQQPLAQQQQHQEAASASDLNSQDVQTDDLVRGLPLHQLSPVSQPSSSSEPAATATSAGTEFPIPPDWEQMSKRARKRWHKLQVSSA